MGKSKKLYQNHRQVKGSERPLMEILQEPELTKENCSDDAWEKLGGKAVEEAMNANDDLPF